MAAQTKGITVQMGIMPIHLKMEVATITESRTRVVCTAGGKHAVTAVKQQIVCPECSETHSSYFGFPERAAVLSKNDLRVLSKEDMEQAKGAPRTGRAPVDKDGRLIAQGADVMLRFHPRSEVFASTLAGDAVQNVYPDVARGSAKGYQMLVAYLSAHPDTVATMIWAPSKNNALWVLEVVDGRLVAGKRCWPEEVRDPRQIDPVTVAEAEQALFDQIVALSAEHFNVNEYVNEARRGLQDLIDAADGNGRPVAGAVKDHDQLALLQALLEATKAEQASRRGKAA